MANSVMRGRGHPPIWLPAPISRRRFLKGLGLGAAAGLTWPILQACGGGEEARGVATPTATGTIPAEGEKVTLNIMLTNIPWTDAILTTVADAYSQHTNGRVTITGEQVPYEAHYEKIALELSSDSSTFDIITSDTIWIRQWHDNGWILCLQCMKEEDPSLPDLNFADFLDGPYIFSTFEGKRWGIHATQSTPVFVYRKDLLEEAGIDPPGSAGRPWNWDEYRDAAAKLTTGDVFGTTMLLGGQDAAMGDFMFRVMGYDPNPPGNDFLLDDDNKPIFNENNRGVRAIERMKEILPYIPPGALNFDYPDGPPLLQEGKVAFTVHWLDMWPGLEDPAQSKFVGKFGYTVSPTDNVSQHMVAGWGMFINAASRNPIEAYKFLAWMLEGKAYQLFREAGETTLIYKPDLENPEVLKQIPLLNVYQDMKKYGTTYTAFPPYKVTNAAEIQRLIYEEVLAAVVGDKSPEAAMKDAENRVIESLKATGQWKG